MIPKARLFFFGEYIKVMAASAHHSTARCADRDAAWRLRSPCRPCASSNVPSASETSSTCGSSDFASLAAAAKARVLAGLAASLRSADGWESRASSAEEFAAATGRAVLGLGPAELAAVREKLLSDGVRRQEELASAEQLAAAVFERALSGKLIEEAQRSGDYWGGASAVPAAQCRRDCQYCCHRHRHRHRCHCHRHRRHRHCRHRRRHRHCHRHHCHCHRHRHRHSPPGAPPPLPSRQVAPRVSAHHRRSEERTAAVARRWHRRGGRDRSLCRRCEERLITAVAVNRSAVRWLCPGV